MSSQIIGDSLRNISPKQEYPNVSPKQEHPNASLTNFNPFQGVYKYLIFFKRFVQDPISTGSLVPSSKALARSITKYIPENPDPNEEPRHYLEVGPGTGVFTDEILRKMKPTDTLDLVEYSKEFCEYLIKKYKNHSKRDCIHIHHKSILDWKERNKYDAVISGLPLNSFTPEMVIQCIEQLKSVTKESGTISYFEYWAMPWIKSKILWGETKQKFLKILETKGTFLKDCGKYVIGQKPEVVWRNFTPATVLHFKPGKKSET